MKKLNIDKIKFVLCAILIISFSIRAFAYPPDNAAVLYQKAFLFAEIDRQTQRKLRDVIKGKTNIDKTIKEYVEKNRLSIDSMLTAADIAKCDWGTDYSKGFSTMMPHLSQLRDMVYLILTDAKILAENGNYREAFSRCITINKMAGHISEGFLVSNLVAISLNQVSYECLAGILSQGKAGIKELKQLRDNFQTFDDEIELLKECMRAEKEMALMEMTKERMNKVLADDSILGEIPDDMVKKIKEGDEEFYSKSRDYYKQWMEDLDRAFDLDYNHAFKKIKELSDKPVRDAEKGLTKAVLVATFAPALTKIYNNGIKAQSYSRATKAAIEVYLIKAKIGKLPAELPQVSVKDTFSNREFAYKVTSNGFVISCQGKDLLEGKIHEYEFKIKK